MKKSLLVVLIATLLISGCSIDAAQNISTNTLPVATNINTTQVVTPPANSPTSVEYAFTKARQHPEKLLISVIDSAKKNLDIAIYSITLPGIIAAIKDARKRGVTVRIITDKIQAAGKTQSEALKILGSADIPMKINIHSGLMHMKVTIADDEIVTTGSFNYSAAASTTNDEVLVVIRDSDAAKTFEVQFERMWNDKKGFEAITPKIAQ